MSLIVAAVLLAAVLVFAVVRPRGLPEAVAAVPAAALAIALGLVSWDDAWAEFRELGPTVGFLAAILLLAHLADEHGVFQYAGRAAARISRGDPPRLLVAVFVTAALTTAFLSLDATVVLLTPVVLATAARVGARARPSAFASAHLANSASLLLPVSNLTNLLAFAASGLGFLAFTGLMTLPWLAVIVVEYLVFRLYFRADLRVREQPRPDAGNGPAPAYALTVLGLTLAGFAVVHPLGVHPAWGAVTGAAFLAVPHRVPPRTLIREANLPFCAFVLALGVVVLAVQQHGLESFLAAIVPHHADLLGLLAVAFLGAVLANLLNNLPATLALLPVVEARPGLLLAMLIGVNVGPNLTYVGSLATLLWRQILHTHDAAPHPRDFLRLGVLTVPPALVAGVLALWVSLRLAGIAD
ncbi:SLC13 family permease [Paractinoplanes brasiliensis]|uniref:Arsenite efflux membrane protein ArsB n=1 Tax=Paractinoplanes brasiliensis TaxID=52695 RepID=A0A4R6JR40_9ACTN|nr:SLC13 family permease [Actinoplanes brasiliensis]TDO39024.1 arsenite efflux membrane protein ArsB [Actinoplanes brasiliensis]